MVLRDEGRGNKDQSDQKMAGPDAQGQGEKHIKSARKILDAQGERPDQDLFVGPLKFGQQRKVYRVTASHTTNRTTKKNRKNV